MFKNTRTEAKGNVNLETEIMNLSSGLQQKKKSVGEAVIKGRTILA